MKTLLSIPGVFCSLFQRFLGSGSVYIRLRFDTLPYLLRNLLVVQQSL